MTVNELCKILNIPVQGDGSAEALRMVPNFPKDGVTFIDFSTLLVNPQLCQSVLLKLAPVVHNATKIVCVDARGFILGGMLANLFHKPVVLARKKGKLPPPVLEESYALEYGEDTITIEEGLLNADDVPVIVDDVVATGGTLNAVVNLCKRCGCTRVAAAALIDLAWLHKELPCEFKTVLKFESEV